MSTIKPWAGHYGVILLICGLVVFTNLGGPRLWDRDEPRNAGCAAEMKAAGDWVVPVFNGQLRSAKPVLLYWLMMSAYAMFGVNEFAARFWCAVLAVGAVLVTYHIGRRLFSPQIALWGAIILATSLMFDVVARAATPDSLLIFFSSASLLVFVLGTFRPGTTEDPPASLALRVEGHYFPSRLPVVALMYALMGIGVLAKGPVAWFVPTAVIGMFLLIMRLPADTEPPPPQHAARWQRVAQRVRWLLRPFAPRHFLGTCWLMRPLTAIAVVSAVALPWYVWVGVRTGGAWPQGFFLNENLGRALRPMENHSGPIFYYLPAIMIGFFPWSVFMGPTLVGAVRRIRGGQGRHAGTIFLLCWLGVYVGLFSLARTKLPSYVTPAYPALALLAGCFVFHWSQGTSRVAAIWPRLGVLLMAVVGVGITIGVYLAARRFLPGDEWLAGIGLILSLGGVGCWMLLRSERPRAAAVTFAATAVVFNTAVFGFASLRVDRHQQNHVLLNSIAARSEHPQIGALGALEPSLVYYAGRPIVKLQKTPEQASQAAANIDTVWTPDGRPTPIIDAVGFLQTSRDAFVITTERHYRDIASRLPAEVEVVAEAPYFLKRHRLLVLGWHAPSTRTAGKGRDAIRR